MPINKESIPIRKGCFEFLKKVDFLPKPVSPQNLLYGRHIEPELGIEVITILECVCGKRGKCNLLITDYKSLCFSKSLVSRLQGSNGRITSNGLFSPVYELAIYFGLTQRPSPEKPLSREKLEDCGERYYLAEAIV